MCLGTVRLMSTPNRMVWAPLVLLALAAYSYCGWMYSSAGYDIPMVTKLAISKFGTPPAQGSSPTFVPGIPSTSLPYLSLYLFGSSIWCELVLHQVASTTMIELARKLPPP